MLLQLWDYQVFPVCMVSNPVASNITSNQFNWRDIERTWWLAPCLWKLTRFGQWRSYRRPDFGIHSVSRWKPTERSPFYHPNRIVRRKLQLLFYIHEVNTIKPFLPKETVIMSFMRKCHLSISVVPCPQKLFIQVLGGYSPRQIHLFIYHLRASRQIKPGSIITGKFDLLETLLSHCKHKLTK